MNKSKTLKYRVTVGTEQPKEFRRHRDMKNFVRTLDPAKTFFNTEYWNRRSGINGAYMPSWEWSTEGQLQYQANRAAHLARKANVTEKQMAIKEDAKARKTTRIASERAARAPKAKTIA